MNTIALNFPKNITLHFDVNKTIINSDSVTGKTKEEVLINQLAETTSAAWAPHCPKMTYSDYVKKIVVPGENSDKEVKSKRRVIIKNFLDVIKSYPELAQDVQNKYKQLNEKATDSIFTSFVRLIEILQICHINFTVIIRTFGNDLESVTKEITHKTKIKFSHHGKFEQGILNLEKKVLTATQDIFKEFSNTGAHTAIQDDYRYWNENKEQSPFGKKFILDPNSTTDLSLFFDDNLTGQEKDIIAPYNTFGVFVPTYKLMNKNLFCVDTSQAILDDNYYINLVNLALKANNFSTM